MPSKWDAVLDQKPVPIQEHLLVECSKLFANDLNRWPPPVEELSGTSAQLLAANPVRPAPLLLREAFRLARWELERALDAYDDYMRNRRWEAAGLTASEKPMLL